MKELFGIEVEEIILAGQSYGGGTIFDTKAYINKNFSGDKLKYFKRIIGLDPWFFPLEDEQYSLLKN